MSLLKRVKCWVCKGRGYKWIKKSKSQCNNCEGNGTVEVEPKTDSDSV